MFSILGAELMFILLPFLVSGIVFTYLGDVTKIFYLSEWSLAASILFGQSLIKFIIGIMKMDRRAKRVRSDIITFIISFVIIVGIVPSLLILSFVLTSENVSTALATSQIVLFIFGFLSFFILGGAGHLIQKNEEPDG